jgi:hypothetical protein
MRFKWGGRRQGDADRPSGLSLPPSAAAELDRELPTKVLKKFLACLVQNPTPTLLDLGPVVGSNVSYFGEQLGCKIHVEDLYAELDRATKQGTRGELKARILERLSYDPGSIDGVLCWDAFDYLERDTATALARKLVALLAPGGALVAFFSTIDDHEPVYTRYVIVDDQTLRHRVYEAHSPRGPVWANRDITRLFDGLIVGESFLLLTKMREMLFRKPGEARLAEVAASPGP